MTSSSEYRYAKRGLLRVGQRFRVLGGPHYVDQAGKQIPMGVRGTFVFLRYCVDGRAKWIEAVRPNEVTIERLPVSRRKSSIEGYHALPYRVRAIRGR